MPTYDVMFSITTDGCGGVFLENPEGQVLQRRRVTSESDDVFASVVSAMIAREMRDQYTRH